MPFGTAKNHQNHSFVANYKGPLFPVKILSSIETKLTATHQDINATMGLVNSAQSFVLNKSVTPNRVNGEASFFSQDGSDMLFGDFSGIVIDRDGDNQFDVAYVGVVFTGGTGRFVGATGTGSVEAELYPDKGFSQGRIEATVNLPTDR